MLSPRVIIFCLIIFYTILLLFYSSFPSSFQNPSSFSHFAFYAFQSLRFFSLSYCLCYRLLVSDHLLHWLGLLHWLHWRRFGQFRNINVRFFHCHFDKCCSSNGIGL